MRVKGTVEIALDIRLRSCAFSLRAVSSTAVYCRAFSACAIELSPRTFPLHVFPYLSVLFLFKL